MAPSRTIGIHFVHSALRGARGRGVDVWPVLVRAGIPPALLDDSRARVTREQYAELIRGLWDVLDDEFLGLGDFPCRRGTFAMMFLLVISSPDLATALRRAADFYGLFPSTLRFRLETPKACAGRREVSSGGATLGSSHPAAKPAGLSHNPAKTAEAGRDADEMAELTHNAAEAVETSQKTTEISRNPDETAEVSLATAEAVGLSRRVAEAPEVSPVETAGPGHAGPVGTSPDAAQPRKAGHHTPETPGAGRSTTAPGRVAAEVETSSRKAAETAGSSPGVAETFRLTIDLGSLADPDHFVTECLVMIWHRVVGWAIDQRVLLVRLEFGYPPPPHVAEYGPIFGCHMSYGQARQRSHLLRRVEPRPAGSLRRMPCDEPVSVDVEIFPASWSIQPGHKLRLAVQTGDFPRLFPPFPQLKDSLGGDIKL
ncbi:AraC family transcriptional regulator ligand-binding domain-containing protein [Spirillospora sp. NPDC048911]|uniref:AraC family transcriptional regulator ligand-binding domain-containing protein n=1 Tax=Spirillospora sp. NPDC048911 TaxID=3364527 RepID=UPI0037234CBB